MPTEVDMKLEKETRRVYAIAAEPKHDIALANPDFGVYIVCKPVFGNEKDVLIVKDKNSGAIVVEIELGGPKKPPIIGGE